MNLIAAVDKNWAIGKNGKLLASIRDDMEHFRDHTTGNVVVMGRKTLESLPGGRPLPDRINIVLTSNKSFAKNGLVICHTVEEVLEEVSKYDSRRVYIIGGETIYRQFLDYCDTAYITKIDFEYDADTYFPNLDKDSHWKVVEESEELTSFDLAYYFLTYKKHES